MTSDQKRVAVIAAALVTILAAFLLFVPARQKVLPKPRAAHAAIEVDGEGIARIGEKIELPAGTPFTLRAVLEAETWRGVTVYYTEAERLAIAGVEVPKGTLRPWHEGHLSARVLWFSVEPSVRYKEVAPGEDLPVPTFREVFRADWPQAWSAPGSVVPSFAETELRVTGVPWPSIGILRYMVRVELFGPESKIRPRQRFSSPGPEVLPESAASFSTVTFAAPDTLAVTSRRLGLGQIEPLGEPSRETRAKLLAWTESEIAFSRLVLLRLHVKAAGVTLDQLDWEVVELDGSSAWGGAGDLIQAGSRVVVAYEDRGLMGRLDEEDLALNYDRGGNLVHLKAIFPGEGLVERARLSARENEAGGE